MFTVGLSSMRAAGSNETMLRHCEGTTNYSNFIHTCEYVQTVKELAKDLGPISRCTHILIPYACALF